MNQPRLSALAVLEIEKDVLIDLDKIVDIFAEQKNRRVDFF